jgi:hypothetical protein
MYSSLDRVDIVAADPATGGEKLVQTDHRQAAEVEAEPELSVIFALTRVINARKVAAQRQAANAAIHYVCFDRPPPFLHQAVAAAGGEVVLLDAVVPFAGERRDAGELADQAFRALAERVQRTRGAAAVDEALLRAIERDLDDEGVPDREEDEIAYWTRVVELAAVGGELLRARTGGRWVVDQGNYADVPFVFVDRAGAILNVANKAKKRLDLGPSESVAQLLRIVDDEGAPGRPMLTLKPADWDGRAEAVSRPLLEGFPESPLVAFGTDLPNTFAILTTRGASGGEAHDVAALEAKALETLRTIEVSVEDLEVTEALRLMVVSGDYFACEKLLDRDFMRGLEARAGSPLLAAGIPAKGLLLVTSAVVQPETMGGFMAICEGRYNDAAPRERVSPAVFLVQEGAVCGVVRASGS